MLRENINFVLLTNTSVFKYSRGRCRNREIEKSLYSRSEK